METRTITYEEWLEEINKNKEIIESSKKTFYTNEIDVAVLSYHLNNDRNYITLVDDLSSNYRIPIEYFEKYYDWRIKFTSVSKQDYNKKIGKSLNSGMSSYDIDTNNRYIYTDMYIDDSGNVTRKPGYRILRELEDLIVEPNLENAPTVVIYMLDYEKLLEDITSSSCSDINTYITGEVRDKIVDKKEYNIFTLAEAVKRNFERLKAPNVTVTEYPIDIKNTYHQLRDIEERLNKLTKEGYEVLPISSYVKQLAEECGSFSQATKVMDSLDKEADKLITKAKSNGKRLISIIDKEIIGSSDKVNIRMEISNFILSYLMLFKGIPSTNSQESVEEIISVFLYKLPCILTDYFGRYSRFPRLICNNYSAYTTAYRVTFPETLSFEGSIRMYSTSKLKMRSYELPSDRTLVNNKEELFRAITSGLLVPKDFRKEEREILESSLSVDEKKVKLSELDSMIIDKFKLYEERLNKGNNKRKFCNLLNTGFYIYREPRGKESNKDIQIRLSNEEVVSLATYLELNDGDEVIVNCEGLSPNMYTLKECRGLGSEISKYKVINNTPYIPVCTLFPGTYEITSDKAKPIPPILDKVGEGLQHYLGLNYSADILLSEITNHLKDSGNQSGYEILTPSNIDNTKRIANILFGYSYKEDGSSLNSPLITPETLSLPPDMFVKIRALISNGNPMELIQGLIMLIVRLSIKSIQDFKTTPKDKYDFIYYMLDYVSKNNQTFPNLLTDCLSLHSIGLYSENEYKVRDDVNGVRSSLYDKVGYKGLRDSYFLSSFGGLSDLHNRSIK